MPFSVQIVSMGGGHRRSRGNNNAHHQHRHPESSSTSVSRNSSAETKATLDFNIVLQEVEGGFQVTWKEITLATVGIASLALISICVGIAAGMTISIHYFESQSPSMRRMDPRDTLSLYSGVAAYQRVTSLDHTIASTNVVQKDRGGLDLGKVITTTASGQLKFLLVVEESAPLHTDGSSTEDSSEAKNDASYDSSSKSFPMTVEEADSLAPNYSKWKASQPFIELRKSTVHPILCSDQNTVGFNDWNTLRAAVQEANSISAERFMKWSAYFANIGKSFAAFEDDLLYYEQDVVFTICPAATLRGRGSIFINAENVVIECDDCTVNVGGTHLDFGPHAKNVLVRGLTFKSARTSSLTFFHDGAEASFEDCYWIGNSAMSSKFGAVADVNSTSTINFYRCEIGQGERGFSGAGPGSASSLSIRA